MQVCEIMRAHPLSITELDSAEYAARMMREHNVGVLPVVAHASAGNLIGVLTDRDLVLRVMSKQKEPATTLIRDCMSKQPISCGPLDDVQYAILVMHDRQVRGLPVVDMGNHLVGMLTISDLVGHYVESEEIEALLRSISRTHAPVAG